MDAALECVRLDPKHGRRKKVANHSRRLAGGAFLNLAPVDFGRVVGLYMAALFVVWQLINFVALRALPTMSILAGGGLVIAGGAIITFWRPA